MVAERDQPKQSPPRCDQKPSDGIYTLLVRKNRVTSLSHKEYPMQAVNTRFLEMMEG